MAGKFKELAERVGELVDEKNANYGNSFSESGEFLKLLYPNGIPPESYGDMLCVVRIFDKLKRIATKKDAFGESPYSDIVGYGLLGLDRDERIKEKMTHLQELADQKLEECFTAEGGELSLAERVDAAWADEVPSGVIKHPETGEEMVFTHCASCTVMLPQPVPTT